MQENPPKIQGISATPAKSIISNQNVGAKILGIAQLETVKEKPPKIQAISASPAKSTISNENVDGKILGIAGKILQFVY